MGRSCEYVIVQEVGHVNIYRIGVAGFVNPQSGTLFGSGNGNPLALYSPVGVNWGEHHI